MNRRDPTQPAKPGWPFLYSVVPGRGVVKNVVREPRPRVKIKTEEPQPAFAWPFPPGEDLGRFNCQGDYLLPNGVKVPREAFEDPPF